jgi:predicted nucleic acid-binding protein
MARYEGEDVVIDASVAVKWFTEEAGTPAALELRDSHIAGGINLVAPDLLFYEVFNALRYKEGAEEEILKGQVWDMVDLQMDIVAPSQHLMEKTVDNSLKFGLSIYDSVYFSLAELSGSELITADEKFYNVVKDNEKVRAVLLK